MKPRLLTLATAMFISLGLSAETTERYIEVTGTAEIEIVPDRIHYIIEIKEYFEEEFDGKSKPEEFRTKVPLDKIERDMYEALDAVGISRDDIRTQEVGDYWRRQGQDFLISKKFDITLTDYRQIDKIVKLIDTKGISTMRIGDLESDRMQEYHRQGKIDALKAAQEKATYLAESIGIVPGKVLRIVEDPGANSFSLAQSNVFSSDIDSYDNFRTIKRKYSMLVRFEIKDHALDIARPSTANLIIFYDPSTGKEPLLKAVEAYGSKIIYQYGTINGIAVTVPDDKTAKEAMDFYKCVEGVLSVTKDEAMELHQSTSSGLN